MRGKLSDQDLTDYALNELEPEVRLYMESMLAVSEECRNDVYEMMDMRELLEEGFECEMANEPLCALTSAQRDNLVSFQPAVPFWERAALAAGLAACAAFVLTHPVFWQTDDPEGRVAQVSSQMSRLMADAVSPEKVNFAAPLATIAAFAEEPSNWLPVAAEVLDPMVCTPPAGADGMPAILAGE